MTQKMMDLKKLTEYFQGLSTEEQITTFQSIMTHNPTDPAIIKAAYALEKEAVKELLPEITTNLRARSSKIRVINTFATKGDEKKHLFFAISHEIKTQAGRQSPEEIVNGFLDSLEISNCVAQSLEGKASTLAKEYSKYDGSTTRDKQVQNILKEMQQQNASIATSAKAADERQTTTPA